MKICTALNVLLRLIPLALGSGVLFLGLNNYAFAAQFDHSYQNFSQLLVDVVQVSDDKKQSRVNYPQLAVNQGNLNRLLNQFSEVTKGQYDAWTQEQKLSFLINAYNGFTLKLIVDNWDEFKQGEAQSIRDLGSLFNSPWEMKFFSLFGQTHALDDIEHEMVRKWFKEPRIHAALVCAAISCPPLRNQAFVAENLNQQLDNQMQRFLADNSRNQILVDQGVGQGSLSSIFKWYRSDFEKGDGGFNSLYQLLSTYSEAVVEGDTDQQAQRKIIDSAKYPIIFKDYDWRLNNVATF